MKNKIIIVTGQCATGKSTFARRLSQVLGVPFFCKDTLKEALADGIGREAARAAGPRLSEATFETIMHIAEQMFRVEQSAILEANFKPRECERLRSLIDKYGYDCLSYVFTGNLRVLCDRYKRRDDAGERHWSHVRGGEYGEAFVKGQKPLGEFAIGKSIRVDATDFAAVDYDGLHRYAVEFMRG